MIHLISPTCATDKICLALVAFIKFSDPQSWMVFGVLRMLGFLLLMGVRTDNRNSAI